MQPYLTYMEQNGEGEAQYFILQKDHPHFKAVITYTPLEGRLIPAVHVKGYNLWLNFSGVLRGNFVPSYKDVDKEVEATLQAMAIWFYKNRVEKEPKKYKKWKVV
jgi:hypothetical protein